MSWGRSRDSKEHMRVLPVLGLAVLLTLSACAGPAAPAREEGQAGTDRQPTTLRLVSRREPQTLATKYSDPRGASQHAKDAMNAGFALIDNQMRPRGELAEQLPELNADTWKVFPNGTMETTYKLRPGLTWHDGQPLTADDFVFSWQVYRTPGLPFDQSPQNFMDRVAAPDPRTVVITWNRPSVEAGVLGTNFAPLPAHVLGERFQNVERDPGAADGFANATFWSQEFIGSGPYRLERWEPGAFVEGLAFDGYALGRPKIDRVIVRFMGDENTVLTNVLAGELDYAPTLTMRFEHLEVLKRDWVASGKGTGIVGPDYFIFIQFQFRPEYQNEPALFDVRARRAMSHALDRQLLADAIFQGETEIAYTWAWKFTPYFAEAERAITNTCTIRD